MESYELEESWNKINYEPPSQYVYKRIDSICDPELNIGINSKLNRCLILELPLVHQVDFQTTNCVFLVKRPTKTISKRQLKLIAKKPPIICNSGHS